MVLPPNLGHIWQKGRQKSLAVAVRTGVLLASRGWRPGMLLRTLWGTGWPPPQSIIQPQMLITLRLRNPGLESYRVCFIFLSGSPKDVTNALKEEQCHECDNIDRSSWHLSNWKRLHHSKSVLNQSKPLPSSKAPNSGCSGEGARGNFCS